MKNKNETTDSIQLELFQTTKKLNLSETYEIIPKEISPNDPNVEWDSKYIANPIEKYFSIEGMTFSSEITPALIKDKKSGKLKTVFPDHREARIEYAIISLASKQLMNIDTDEKNNKIFVLKTTYYQIQKEIVEALNKIEGKNLAPNDCPYNTTSIREALEILKMTTIRVKDEQGEGQYLFNRVKDIYLDDKKVVIELGNMITNYISSGDWKATDTDSILASRGRYERKLRVLLNLKFRYATIGSHYNPSLSYLIDYLDFPEFKQKRIALQRITKIIENLHEVEIVEVEKKYQGRKIIDAIFNIYPTKDFISIMIENNKITKRTKDPILDDSGKPLIKPIQTDFKSNAEFMKSKREYDIKKGKSLIR